MGKDNSITKLAIVGATKLTLNGMQAILELQNYKILYVFGLKDENLAGKVNSVSLDEFCASNGIALNKSENWDDCYDFCQKNDISMIVTLGDSRIVPKNIINSFEVIGNHGAILPYIQGGASLVWGRILNSGVWGVSMMQIGERIDGGDILKTETFIYDTHSTTEEEFTAKADNLTVELLIEVLNGNYKARENTKWEVRISKHTDSYKTIELLSYCLANDICVYLPPRTIVDGIVKKEWPDEFTRAFKIANNKPYPKWSE
jgi:methionyl-tRNA formyltransferase|tara:strand:- start:807 stop:1586 length:780 start_codon:yes stop_codon:yes gene_type:complete